MSFMGTMGRIGLKISLILTMCKLVNNSKNSKLCVHIPFKDWVIFLDILVDCWNDVSFLLIKIPTKDDVCNLEDLVIMFWRHLKVTIWNNAPIWVRCRCAIKAELHSCLLDCLYIVILSWSQDKDIIRSHANLWKGKRFSQTTLQCDPLGGAFMLYPASIQGFTI